ncbi:hypothetical protein D910_07785 [Dendroctonus ponderosae]|uniref:Ig-like domain-containing protein n=1 Tax=Dendroctonus ponderosae TaxID=77166 RepID=U4UJS8_DENPD|nr:hypothetical protein D910_07785 [Dendroctonus ponderosae]
MQRTHANARFSSEGASQCRGYIKGFSKQRKVIWKSTGWIPIGVDYGNISGIQKISSVKINQLLVPEIASPASSPIILDCDYSLEFPKDEGLVVKWFFNERLYPVYQWIPDAKPQELGILKGRLDLTFRASEDRYMVHRALKIIQLSPELAGNFTCSVSTFSSEDTQTKRMLVFGKSLE